VPQQTIGEQLVLHHDMPFNLAKKTLHHPLHPQITQVHMNRLGRLHCLFAGPLKIKQFNVVIVTTLLLYNPKLIWITLHYCYRSNNNSAGLQSTYSYAPMYNRYLKKDPPTLYQCQHHLYIPTSLLISLEDEL
jgi:hypothetical protein